VSLPIHWLRICIKRGLCWFVIFALISIGLFEISGIFKVHGVWIEIVSIIIWYPSSVLLEVYKSFFSCSDPDPLHIAVTIFIALPLGMVGFLLGFIFGLRGCVKGKCQTS